MPFRDFATVRTNLRRAAGRAYPQGADSAKEFAFRNAAFRGAGCDSPSYEDQKAFFESLDARTQAQLEMLCEREYWALIDELTHQ